MNNTGSTAEKQSRVIAQEASAQQKGEKLRRYALLPWLSRDWVLGVAFFLIAMGFNLYRLGVPSIWFDEAFSVELARQPFPLLWQIIFGPEPNMELYYLFLHGWLGLTSLLGLHDTEFVVRLPSTIFAASSTVVVFLLGRRLLGVWAGIIGASLYLLNGLQLVYAQQARSYSIQLLLICIAWYALLAIFTSEPKKRWWVYFVVATVLAIYAHLFSLVILVSQLVAVGGFLLLSSEWRAKVRQQLPALALSLLSIGVLSIPMFLVSLHGAKTGWLTVPHLRDVYHLFLTISSDSKIYLLVLVACCVLGLAVIALARFPSGVELLAQLDLVRRGDEEQTVQLQRVLPVALALICWLVVPVVVSYLLSQGSLRLFSSRYLVTIVPPLFLLVGLGMMVIRWRVVRVTCSVGLVLLALLYVPLYYQSAQVEDWNSTSHWLEQHYQPGDGLVCYDNDVEQGCQISIEYYLHAYPSVAHFTPDSPGAFSWQTFSSPNPEAAVDPQVLAAYAANHTRLFFIVGRLPNDAAAAHAQAAQQWLDANYHLIASIGTRTVSVRLYAVSVYNK